MPRWVTATAEKVTFVIGGAFIFRNESRLVDSEFRMRPLTFS
jgi:hypothetical protein